MTLLPLYHMPLLEKPILEKTYNPHIPYVAGLGPRKTLSLTKAIRVNGNTLVTRRDLVGDAEAGKAQAVGGRVYINCASFLRIIYDVDDDVREADPLDDTRIHPQDYDIARKMAADALELDEEDIEQELADHGDGAIVRKLIKDNKRSHVEDLVIEEYAEQLWERFHQRKRSTLQMIRSELQDEFEELREKFEDNLRTNVIFTMFTGETRDSLEEGMIVPMNVRKVGEDFIEGRLDCGIEASVEAGQISDDGRSARQLFAPHTTIQAKILRLDKQKMHARLTVLDSELRNGYVRRAEWGPEEWDEAQEAQDQEAMRKKDTAVQRQQRVIKHPNFRSFSAMQAEEYLGSQAIGEVVIRPSSKGLDHLVVTWKVADGVYKHIDVLELDKENEFSLGRTLKVDGRWSYSDLDELIQSHVKQMSKKVDEMMSHEKYQRGTKAETETWLSTYLEANPGRSMYAFCINPRAPGYFHLCFKANAGAPLGDWNVKVTPGAYELQKNQYPDMTALCNGFKTLYKSALQNRGMVRR